MSNSLQPLRVVIAGPPDSGKLTALRSLLSKVPPKRRGKLIPRKLGEDILLSIDIRLGSSDADRPLRLMTVQGAASDNRTWRTLLRKVDGVVFVADARPGKLEQNRAAHVVILDALHGWNNSPESIAWVYAWNRRDESDKTTAAELSQTLNTRGFAEFETVAKSGYGLFLAFKSLLEQIIERNVKSAEAVAEPGEADGEVPGAEPASGVAEPETGEERPRAKARNNWYGLAASFDRVMQDVSPRSSFGVERSEPVESEEESPTPAEPEPLDEAPEVPEETPAPAEESGEGHEAESTESGLVGLDTPPDIAFGASAPPTVSAPPEEAEEVHEPEGANTEEESPEPEMPERAVEEVPEEVSEKPEVEPASKEPEMEEAAEVEPELEEPKVKETEEKEPDSDEPQAKPGPGGPSFHFPETRTSHPKPPEDAGKSGGPGDPSAPSWKKLLTRSRRNDKDL